MGRRPLIGALGLLAAAALSMPVAAEAGRAGRDDVRGLWVDHREPGKRKVAVWIEDCEGLLCGSIYWLKKPLTSSGRPKRDHRNPDAGLRDRPLCGLKILTGFRQSDDRVWDTGQIYNPSDGRTFSSTMILGTDGTLQISGYIGIALLGKTVVWVRPEASPGRCR